MMTVAAAFMGLLPIMWSTSAGADVMKRIAAPMIGGLVTSFALELLVYPAVYKLWKGASTAKGSEQVGGRGDRVNGVVADGGLVGEDDAGEPPRDEVEQMADL